MSRRCWLEYIQWFWVLTHDPCPEVFDVDPSSRHVRHYWRTPQFKVDPKSILKKTEMIRLFLQCSARWLPSALLNGSCACVHCEIFSSDHGDSLRHKNSGRIRTSCGTFTGYPQIPPSLCLLRKPPIYEIYFGYDIWWTFLIQPAWRLTWKKPAN